MWSKAGVQQFASGALHYTQKGIHLVQSGMEIAGALKGAYAVGGQIARAGAAILPLII
jgi:hypothetical protein